MLELSMVLTALSLYHMILDHNNYCYINTYSILYVSFTAVTDKHEFRQTVQIVTLPLTLLIFPCISVCVNSSS